MRSRRFGGLDGLRAIAVALVLGYHLFPTALPGGFLGVDIFFAISGFLITSLLLREYRRSGTINLIDFWRRRARRLLPALGLVLLVCASLAALVRGDLLVNIGKQIAGAAFFVSNWVYIAIGSDYFTRDNPEIFRNTWSLAIEEQFYIVLPLLVLVLFRAKGRLTRMVPFLILGTLSAVMMIDASAGGDPATRIYFGSDTHVFGLFLGAALAVILSRRAGAGIGAAAPDATAGATAEPAGAVRMLRELGLGLVAVAGLSVLGWLTFTLREGSPESFQGGFQLATLAALATIWAITREGAVVGRMLDVTPLRWIGERSYGIYLWHWPLLVIFSEAFGTGTPLTIAATFVATMLAATLSYRYLEQPVRRLGLRGAARRLLAGRPRTTRNLAVSLGLAGVLALTVPGTVYAVVTAPEQSTSAAAIARGQAVADAQAEAQAEAGAGAEGADGTAEGREDEQAEPQQPTTGKEASPDGSSFTAGPMNALEELVQDAQESQQETRTKPPTAQGGKPDKPKDGTTTTGQTPLSPRAEGPEITAVGDSVMLASLPELQEAFPGIAIDAAVSRGMSAGVGIIEEQADARSLRRVVVVGLGTNGPVTAAELDDLQRRIGDRPLVLVDAHAERDWIPGVNKELTAYADARRGVVVARWDANVAKQTDALAGDGIHPNPPGGEIYAKSVEQAIAELDTPAESIGFALPRR